MAPPFSLPVTLTPPVQVYVPPASGRPSVFIYNNGPNPVYVGGSEVTSVSGMMVPPAARVGVPAAVQGVFAVSGFNPTALVGTVSTNAAQGGSVLTVASGGSAFTTGAFISIENGSARQEIQAVASQTGSSVTVAGAFAFAHGSTVTFTAVTAATSVLTVSAGAV